MQFSYPTNTFDARNFYDNYKNAEFLQDPDNINKILNMQVDLEHFMSGMQSGQQIQIEGMIGTPSSVPYYSRALLTITKSTRVDERDVGADAVTPRRLSGLTAAYVLDNNERFASITASEAEALGLNWKQHGLRYSTKVFHKIYLSAVSGAEYFYEHFGYYPLVCALKKYQLKQITADKLIDIVKIPSRTGRQLSKQSIYIDKSGPGLTFANTFDLYEAIESAPEEVKWIFHLGDTLETDKNRQSFFYDM